MELDAVHLRVDRAHVRNLPFALQILRPSATAEITDAVKLLADRSCVGGGWNYGSREVYDTDLEPYAQTTAIGLIGLQGAETRRS